MAWTVFNLITETEYAARAQRPSSSFLLLGEGEGAEGFPFSAGRWIRVVSPGDGEPLRSARNSHDKSFPVGIGFGSHVFVCDNLALVADHVIKRRHTANAKRDLPGLIQEVIEPLAAQRDAQQRNFGRYYQTPLTDQMADHAILMMYRAGVINSQRIAEVAREWDYPTFEEFHEKNVWRLFNAAIYVLSGRVAENPRATRYLHEILDDVCEAA